MPLPLLFSLAFLLGVFNGLRTMTPVAVLCWGAHLGWFSLAHTPFFFLAQPVSLIVFSLLAVGEFVGDKLPKTPARTEFVGLAARVAFAAACGAVLAAVAGLSPFGSAGQSRFMASWLLSAFAGGVGGFIGTYAGFLLRRALTRSAGLPDFPVALVEDLVAVGGSLFVVSRF